MEEGVYLRKCSNMHTIIFFSNTKLDCVRIYTCTHFSCGIQKHAYCNTGNYLLSQNY